MKIVLMQLLVAAIPYWVSSGAAQAGDGDVVLIGDPSIFVVKCGSDDGADCDEAVLHVHAATAGVGATCVVAVAGTEDDGRSSGHKVRVKRLARLAGVGDAENMPWLGVSIGNVSSSMTAQLRLDGRGVLVRNVVDGSPADKAGIEAHDIIISLDGDDVDTGRLLEVLATHDPDDTVTVVVLRGGVEVDVSVTLGTRGESPGVNFSWKFEGDPTAEIEDRIHTRGRFMFKDDEGIWTMKDLGDLDELKNLPVNIRMFLPKAGSRSTRVFIEGGNKIVKTKVERDGTAIAIVQDGDGEITVTRTDDDGEEVTVEYDSKEALQEGDEEAFDLLHGAGNFAFGEIHLDGLGEGAFAFDFDFDFDTDVFHEKAMEWRIRLDEGLGDAHEVFARAMEEFEHVKEQLEAAGGSASLEQFEHLKDLFADENGAVKFGPLHAIARIGGKPKQSFEVRTDGTIEVRIRRGDSELVRLFSDEDDLADRDPELAKKFRKLMGDAE